MRPIFWILTFLVSATDASAQTEASHPPAPGAASANQPAPAPDARPAIGPNAPPAPQYDPWTGAPVPYSPPYTSLPPQAYPAYPYPVPTQPGQPPPGFHSHDGFFMRLMMGAGFLKVTSASSGYDLQASGGAFGDMVSFGWSVRENLVLSVDTSVFMGSPSLRGKSRAPDSKDAFFGFMQMGPGLTYYFMPSNVYASANFGFGNIFISERREGQADLDHDMNMGWGAALAGGKEWWTSDNWGLGVAGRFVYVQSREEVTDCLFRGYSLSVAFTATYN